jgi:hypothetical protein
MTDSGVTPVGLMDPSMMAILCSCLLFRLGGQQSFTTEEIQTVMVDYLGIRSAFDPETQIWVLTLKPEIKPDGPG